MQNVYKETRMNNSYYNFDNIRVNNLLISNITDYVTLQEIPDVFTNNNIILQKTLNDDELIDGVSYQLYETTDYWDILLALNKITNISQLPVNYDVVLKRALEEYTNWYNNIIKLQSTISSRLASMSRPRASFPQPFVPAVKLVYDFWPRPAGAA